MLIGGLGFIGRNLIKKINHFFDLIIIDQPKITSSNTDFIKQYGLMIEKCDITDQVELNRIISKHDPKSVVHLAALTGITKCETNPLTSFMINVFGTYNVVMGCISNNIELIFMSSREVYGETISEQSQEHDPLKPNNVYGITKMLGEKLIEWAGSRYNLKYTILRLTNVYGPEGDQYNIQAILKQLRTKGEIQIFGGNQKLNLVYVEDVAETIKRCLNNPLSSKQIINVGSEINLSVEEIILKLVSILGVNTRIVHLHMRKSETVNFKPSLEKLEELLGYIPKTSFDEGLRKTIDWYERNHIDE